MTYVVTEVCIKCKYTDCVEVCPVDCFYEGGLCSSSIPTGIDCGVCEANAQSTPSSRYRPDLEKWLEVNRQYSEAAQHHHQKPAPRMPTPSCRARQVRKILGALGGGD
jgi:ferredoxin